MSIYFKFLQNLENGLKKLSDTFRKTSAGGHSAVSGKDAFELHATYGIPVEVTQSLAGDQNLAVDMEGFTKAQEEHSRVSRGTTEAAAVFIHEKIFDAHGAEVQHPDVPRKPRAVALVNNTLAVGRPSSGFVAGGSCISERGVLSPSLDRGFGTVRQGFENNGALRLGVGQGLRQRVVNLVGKHGAFVHQRNTHVLARQAAVFQRHAEVLAAGFDPALLDTSITTQGYMLPDYLVADFPQLVRVLPEVESGEVPVFLAYPEELRHSKRVAAFRDFVTGLFLL